MVKKQKMTAYNSSAGTDERQSPQLNCTNIISKENSNCNQKFLNTITMSELYDEIYTPKTPIIDGLLYRGVYLFVGAPKVGKSFAMAQIGYHVSSGKVLWNRDVKKGTVLYLALEDDFSRLQGRLYKMFGIEEISNFHFATASKCIGDGLDYQLNKFIDDNGNVSLIIIDTLQKVREIGNEKFSYAKDYEIVTSLKKFADENNLCILLVHHTRKQDADDSFDTISGTNGLLGAADGAFVLEKIKRTDNKAVLSVSGRDQQDQKLHLEFDRERCIWELTEEETEYFKEPKDELLEKISAIVTTESPQWTGTATTLIDNLSLDLKPNILTRKLNVLATRLFNEYNILYENTRTSESRKLIFNLIR